MLERMEPEGRGEREIYAQLRALGITPNYAGYFQMAARIAWERSRAFRGDGWLCFSERIRLPSACCSRCTRALLPTDSTASPCSKRQRFSWALTMDFFFSLPPLALFALFLCVSMLTNTFLVHETVDRIILRLCL